MSAAWETSTVQEAILGRRKSGREGVIFGRTATAYYGGWSGYMVDIGTSPNRNDVS